MPHPSLANIRADHVGSLLRPDTLRHAYRERASGRLNEEEWRGIVDGAIRDAVRMQEEVGLQVVTDGEFRRASWFLGFVEAVRGFKLQDVEFFFHSKGAEAATWRGPVVDAKIRRSGPIVVDDYAFLAGVTRVMPKVTLPAPSAMHFFSLSKSVASRIYPDVDEFFAELARVYREELAALSAAGCRYVQLDEVPLALLCDSSIRERVKALGQEPQRLITIYIGAINDALRGRPKDLMVSMHLCRGNYKGQWLAQGGYEPIAEQLFNQTAVDAFLLEFDTERAGAFSPLRHLPSDKKAFLGLVSTKTNVLEPEDMLLRRLEDAFTYAPAERLGLCPQCGFASSAGGNPISPEMQRAKLGLVTDLARKVWTDP